MRSTIGRKEAADAVMTKITHALAEGMVVSVDIIYGLPGQTMRGLIETLDRLVRAGVDGFSFYQLQVSSRNRGFLTAHGSWWLGRMLEDLFWHAE